MAAECQQLNEAADKKCMEHDFFQPGFLIFFVILLPVF